ncbi:hypothetical protein [Neisseria elongata]|uniref:hypothetical protein n=1 Tax=Neisseria elongata TaxID=495 RepID=UPI0028D3B7E0|nr:hypothetical protein [Neisseria elongata]
MPVSDGLLSERPSEKQNAAPKQPALQTKQAGKPSGDHGDNRTAKKETHVFY